MNFHLKQSIRLVFDNFGISVVWVDKQTGKVYFNCQNSDCRQVTRDEIERTKKQTKK